MRTGVLLIGHGTRRQHGMDEFLSFISAVRDTVLGDLSQAVDSHGVGQRSLCLADGTVEPKLTLCVEHAFLELAEPDIASGLFALAALGAQRIVCVPLLLFSAGHMKHDIPEALKAFRMAKPDVPVTMLEPFGRESAFVQAARVRLMEALSGSDEPRDAVLFLGRGNRDEEAQAMVEDVALRLATSLDKAGLAASERPLRVGYLAGSGTSLESALDGFAARGVRRIAVLPYLWFSGYLTDTLPRRIETWRHERGEDSVDIVIAGHLGIQPELVQAVARRIQEAL